MASTVNSRFMTVGSAEPDLQAGWTIRILDYKDMTSLVAVINEYTAFSFTQELNGPGQGSLTMDIDSPFWGRSLGNGKPAIDSLRDNEYVIEAWDRDTPRFSWLAQTVDETVIGEDETRAIVMSGPGIAAVLNWAPIHRPGYPTPPPVIKYATVYADPSKKIAMQREASHSDALPAFKWQFPVDWPTMRMWYIVFRSAQRRGLLKFVNPLFTSTVDSARKKWKVVKTQQTAVGYGYEPGEPSASLLDFLNDCTGQDYSKWFGQRLEWIMYPGFKLDVREHIGVDRVTAPPTGNAVRFFSGDVLSDQRTRDRENVRNRIIAVDVYGAETTRIDKNSINAWNLREQRNETNKNVTDKGMREYLADRYLAQFKDQKDQWTLKVPYEEPNRTPYRHYFVGDTIGFDVPVTGGFVEQNVNTSMKMRIMAITLSVSPDAATPDVELTLKSLIDSKMDQIEKDITQLINNPRQFDLSDVKNVNIPESPSTSSQLVYNPETKQWEPQPYTGSGGGSGGARFVQAGDPTKTPGVTVNPGDLWLETYE